MGLATIGSDDSKEIATRAGPCHSPLSQRPEHRVEPMRNHKIMRRFITELLALVAKYHIHQGGNVILLQLENRAFQGAGAWSKNARISF